MIDDEKMEKFIAELYEENIRDIEIDIDIEAHLDRAYEELSIKLCLQKEIAAEVVGGIFAEFNRYLIEHPEHDSEGHPVYEKAKEVWLLKESVLGAKTTSEIDQIKAKAKDARVYLECLKNV